MKNTFNYWQKKRLGVTRGDVVRRKSDPVHTGRVVQINVALNQEVFALVRWFDLNVLESRVAVTELEKAEEWK